MSKHAQRGYSGLVTLTSPTGEVRTIRITARHPLDADGKPFGWGTPKGAKVKGVRTFLNSWDAERKNRSQKMLSRMLSAGWRVTMQSRFDYKSGAKREWKKFTKKVDGSTRTGDKTHGGQHNSGEVDHAAETPSDKPRQARGKRSGTQRKSQRKRGASVSPLAKVRWAKQTQGGHVYAPQPLHVTDEILKSAEESAKILKQLAGRSPLKVESGTQINIEELLFALEVGDDPLPALEDPAQKPKAKLLVTPDCSGSTQGWSGLAKAWAVHLGKIPELDVYYVENSNGYFINVDEEFKKLLTKFDVVVYLGDGDGWEMCHQYALSGATVIALDSYCATLEKPRLKKEVVGPGLLFWVDRVSTKAPDTWAQALALATKGGAA